MASPRSLILRRAALLADLEKLGSAVNVRARRRGCPFFRGFVIGCNGAVTQVFVGGVRG